MDQGVRKKERKKKYSGFYSCPDTVIFPPKPLLFYLHFPFWSLFFFPIHIKSLFLSPPPLHDKCFEF